MLKPAHWGNVTHTSFKSVPCVCVCLRREKKIMMKWVVEGSDGSDQLSNYRNFTFKLSLQFDDVFFSRW